jgi:hypothetical protein
MPPDIPHGLKAIQRSKMLLTMIKWKLVSGLSWSKLILIKKFNTRPPGKGGRFILN